MRCEAWRQVEVALDGGADAAAREHLAACRACRGRARRLLALDASLAAGLLADPRVRRRAARLLPAGLSARLAALLPAARGAAGVAGTAGAAGTPGAASATAPGAERAAAKPAASSGRARPSGPCPSRVALERALDDDAGPIRAHLAQCARCRRRARETQLLDEALAGGLTHAGARTPAPEGVGVEPALRADFLARLRALPERAREGQAAAAASGASSAARAPEVAAPPARSNRVGRVSRRLPPGAAATPEAATGGEVGAPAPRATSGRIERASARLGAGARTSGRSAAIGAGGSALQDRQRSARLGRFRALGGGASSGRPLGFLLAAGFLVAAVGGAFWWRSGERSGRGAPGAGEMAQRGGSPGPSDISASQPLGPGSAIREGDWQAPAGGLASSGGTDLAAAESGAGAGEEGHGALLAGDGAPVEAGAGAGAAEGAGSGREPQRSGPEGVERPAESEAELAALPPAGSASGAATPGRRRTPGGIVLPGEEEPASGSGSASGPGSGTVAPPEGGAGAVELARVPVAEAGLRLAFVRGRLLVRRDGAALTALVEAVVQPSDELVAGRGGVALALGGASEAGAPESTRFGLARDRDGRGVHVALHEGSMLLACSAEVPSGALFVHAGFAAAGQPCVEAVGARLVVERSAERTRVDVLEGEVSVRGAAGRVERAGAGQRVLLSASAEPAIGPLPPAERRAQPVLAALMPERRSVVKLDFERGPGFFTRHPVVEAGEGRGRALQAKPLSGDQHYGLIASGKRHLSAQPGVLVRFRYFIDAPRPLVVRGWSNRHDANFYAIERAPVVGRWATFEAAVADFEHAVEAGVRPVPEDVLSTVQIISGVPETPCVLLIDDFEIVELR